MVEDPGEGGDDPGACVGHKLTRDGSRGADKGSSLLPDAVSCAGETSLGWE